MIADQHKDIFLENTCKDNNTIVIFKCGGDLFPNETTPTIDNFFTKIKPEIQKIIGLREVTLVTDYYSLYMNSWSKIIGPHNHILCRWHIKKNLLKNIRSKHGCGMIQNLLIQLMRTHDK